MASSKVFFSFFYFGKGKKQMIPQQTITDVDYADYIVLMANTSAQAESLLHRTSSKWHRPPCKPPKKQNTYALIKEATFPH